MKLATIQMPLGSGCHGCPHRCHEFFFRRRLRSRGVVAFFLRRQLPLPRLPRLEAHFPVAGDFFSAEQLGPVIPKPGKIFCVGLNYREHIEEMEHPIPDHPTLFVKYASAVATPFADVIVPQGMQDKVDYEGELAVVIGASGNYAEATNSPSSRPTIAGYTIMNDLSQRDWQYRTQQWLQGKNLDRSSGFGRG